MTAIPKPKKSTKEKTERVRATRTRRPSRYVVFRETTEATFDDEPVAGIFSIHESATQGAAMKWIRENADAGVTYQLWASKGTFTVQPVTSPRTKLVRQ